MKLDVPHIIHDVPTKEEWKILYQGFHAKLAYLVAKKVYIRNRLAEAQNWRCCWCTKLTVPEPDRKDSATIEHVIPRCEGGPDEWENFAMSCSDCNQRRGVMAVERFLEFIQTPAGQRPRLKKKVSAKNRQKERRRRAREQVASVMEMLRTGNNGFPPTSKRWKMYERYTKRIAEGTFSMDGSHIQKQAA